MDSQFPSAGRPAITPDDALPPVEPPGAGFIVQLFVVPAVIVVFIVIVWFLFNWLAQMGANPQAELEAMRGNRPNRWQAAATLADMLNSKRYEEIKRDPAFARELGNILTNELQGQGDAPQDQDKREEQENFQVYLCNALGLLHTPEALPPLIAAARETAVERELVRRAALESLAVWASQLPEEHRAEEAKLLPVFADALDDSDALVRLRGAFGLGLLHDPNAVPLLEGRLADLSPDVRYNAATGLARHGSAAGAAMLAEMLDPNETVGVAMEPDDETKDAKRGVIVHNALSAVTELAEKNPTADLGQVEAMLDSLIEANIAAELKIRAKETRIALKNRQQAEAPSSL